MLSGRRESKYEEPLIDEEEVEDYGSDEEETSEDEDIDETEEDEDEDTDDDMVD